MGLESIGTRDPKWLIERAHAFLEAGADRIMIESEGITENVKHLRTDVVSSITSALPVDKLMFEAVRADGFPILRPEFWSRLERLYRPLANRPASVCEERNLGQDGLVQQGSDFQRRLELSLRDKQFQKPACSYFFSIRQVRCLRMCM